MHILVGHTQQGTFRPRDIRDMHRLRFRVFRERLQWDIPTLGEQERDEYDNCNPVFVMVRDDGGDVIGCCRLLPTTGPYMLKDTSPVLLGEQSIPIASDIWEISRFAVDKDARGGFGFSSLPAGMIGEVVRYALAQGIKHYVFVTTVAFERMLRRMGVNCERFSEPRQIGIEKSVALWMHIDEQTVNATCTDIRNDSFALPNALHKEAA